jgi:hypothetical protein
MGCGRLTLDLAKRPPCPLYASSVRASHVIDLPLSDVGDVSQASPPTELGCQNGPLETLAILLLQAPLTL